MLYVKELSVVMIDSKLFFILIKFIIVILLFFYTLYFDYCIFSISGYPKQSYFLYDIFLSILIQILFLVSVIDFFWQGFFEDLFEKVLYYYYVLFFMAILYFCSFLIFSDALNFTNRGDKISGTKASLFAICECMPILSKP